MDITPEQQKDIDTRVGEFKKRYGELVKEFQVDFVSFPQPIQISPGVFATNVVTQAVDTKYLSIPSPIQKDSIIKEK